MSMSTGVYGLRDLGHTFDKMMLIKNFCDAQGVSYPKEVVEYFGEDVEEDEDYLRNELAHVDIKYAITEYGTDTEDGFEVDLSKLPEDVTKLRFYQGG